MGVNFMDFHQLETFIKVAEHKSFSRAAEALFLTQPTVSTHVIALEQELGVQLFDRQGKEIELTPAGKIMLKMSLKILEARQDSILELNRFMEKIEGDLILYSSSIPAVYILPGLIKEFKDIYPKLVFRIKQMDSGEVIKALLQDKVEIGITGTCSWGKELEYTPFCKDELVLIAPYNYDKSWCGKDQVKFEDILREKFVLREKMSGTRISFERALSKKGFDTQIIKVAAEMGSSEAVLEAVKHGLGVSIVSNKMIRDCIPMNTVKAYKIQDLQLTRHFYLAYKKNKTLSPNAEAFKNFIVR
jgi:DNA-binding transcriptional LysR family regulator